MTVTLPHRHVDSDRLTPGPVSHILSHDWLQDSGLSAIGGPSKESGHCHQVKNTLPSSRKTDNWIAHPTRGDEICMWNACNSTWDEVGSCILPFEVIAAIYYMNISYL